jgi:branched-chain amino acid transport system permease protein
MKYWKYWIGIVALIVAISLPKFLGIYYLQMLNIILIYAVFALSWDMLMRSGQLSFGIAGFAGIGGYVSVLCTYYFSLNPILSILAGSITAAAVAALVGMAVLRLRLLYFAIVTLAIGEIFRIIIRNLEVTGGAEGMILPNAIFKGDAASTYWLMLAIGVLTIIISIIFQKSRMRFALTAIANDEVVAASSGVNIFKYLVIIFAITSGIQGLSGAAYSQLYGSVTPEGQFSGSFTILPIVMALFGGLGTTWGPVIGAAILTIVAEALKLRIPYGYLLVYGVIMVVAILWFPGGIMGFIKKVYEKINHHQ